MTTTPSDAAIASFADIWGSGDLISTTAPTLTCNEVDALADLFRAHGHDDIADQWITWHTEEDDEGDAHCGS